MTPLVLFDLLMVLQVIDGATTAYALDRDIGHETNLVMRWLISIFGLPIGLLLPKAALLVLTYLYVLPIKHAIPVLAVLIALYAVVAANNVRVILTVKATP